MRNQEVMREWVDRLRSGQYKQGTGRLRVEDHYCCLGVLCEIAAERGIIGSPAPFGSTPLVTIKNGDFHSEDRTVYRYDGQAHMPSRQVYEWAGIPAVGLTLTAKSLADLNDFAVPFAQIADTIEQHWIDPIDIPDTPATIAEEELVNA